MTIPKSKGLNDLALKHNLPLAAPPKQGITARSLHRLEKHMAIEGLGRGMCKGAEGGDDLLRKICLPSAMTTWVSSSFTFKHSSHSSSFFNIDRAAYGLVFTAGALAWMPLTNIKVCAKACLQALQSYRTQWEAAVEQRTNDDLLLVGVNAFDLSRLCIVLHMWVRYPRLPAPSS